MSQHIQILAGAMSHILIYFGTPCIAVTVIKIVNVVTCFYRNNSTNNQYCKEDNIFKQYCESEVPSQCCCGIRIQGNVFVCAPSTTLQTSNMASAARSECTSSQNNYNMYHVTHSVCGKPNYKTDRENINQLRTFDRPGPKNNEQIN